MIYAYIHLYLIVITIPKYIMNISLVFAKKVS